MRQEAEEASRCPITEFERPDYLTDERDIDRFDEIVALLHTVSDQMCTALDADQVARYVVSERDYIMYSKKLRKALEADDIDEAGKVQRQQNAAFKQVQECANAIGMNVASRLKLDLRKPKKQEEEDPFDRFE